MIFHSQRVQSLYDRIGGEINYGYMIRYTDETTTAPDYNILRSMVGTQTRVLVWFKSVGYPYILYSTSQFEPEHEFSDEDYYISREGLHWFSVWRKDSAARG